MKHRHKIATGAAAAALLATAAVAVAEPQREASLTPGGPGFGWDGGPLSGAAAFAEIGAVVPCGPGKECDDTLVRAPQRGQLQVAIDTEEPHPGQDLDLYLFESDENGSPGTQLKSSTTATSTESVSHIVDGGVYLVRVVAAVGNEAVFEGTMSQAVVPPVDEDRRPPDFGPDPAPNPDGSTGDGDDAEGGGGQPQPQPQPQPGTRVTPAATNAAPLSAVRRPGRRSRRLKGTAIDVDGSVQYVDVALVRLRGDNRCRALTPRGGWRRIRKCGAPPFVRARGDETWRVRMNRRLRPGRYALYSRATDNVGKPEGGFGAGNLITFRVKRK